MSESDPGAQPPTESDEAARDRRLRALRELAAQRTGLAPSEEQNTAPAEEQVTVSPGSEAAVTSPRPQRRRVPIALWVGAVVALCVTLVVVGVARVGLLPGLRFGAQTAPPAIAMTTHDLRADGIVCLQDSAWSPKGARLAILGYQNDCSAIFQGASLPGGIVSVYDATSRRSLTQFSLDTLIKLPANDFIQYQNILWSPDGRRLAVTFTTLVLGSLPGINGPVVTPNGGGVLLTDTSGARPQVLMLPAGKGNGTALGTFAMSGEWDVLTGKALSAPTIPSSAVEYQWGANGALRPVTGAAPQAVGNPDGGQTFTVWQPGSAQLGLVFPDPNNPNTASVIPGFYIWNSDFAAWSPDGRYFYAPFSVGRRVTLPNQPAPNAQLLHTTGFDQFAPIAPHDATLASLCLTLSQYANVAQQSGGANDPTMALAWRLDGRILAEQAFVTDANGNATPGFYTLILYDTVTGHVLAHLSHDAHLSASSQTSSGLVRWSPDGKHLALADSAFDSLTIWTFNKPLV